MRVSRSQTQKAGDDASLGTRLRSRIKMTSFVSARELEAAKQLKKEQKRAMRDDILREAKENFEREKKRQELKRERGDDIWMAPGVSERLGLRQEDEGRTPERKKTKKRHKKERKSHKKYKEPKKAHRDNSDEDNSSSDTEGPTEGMWVEAGTDGLPMEKDSNATPASRGDGGGSAVGAPLRREDWMTMALAPSAMSVARLTAKRANEEEEKGKQSAKEPASFDRPGQHPRELNPFWKDGGEGLPPEEQRVSEGRGSDAREKPRGVGDGRRSWMLRAYKRALEQAENEGKPLEEIASDRWGSIEKLHSLLRTAGIDPTNPDARPPSGRKEYLHSHSWDREDERRRRRAREEGDCHGERDERRRGEGERRDGRRDDGSRREGRRERGGRREEEDRERDRRRPRGNAGGFLKPGEPAGLDSNHFAGFTTSSSSRAATSSSDNWRKKRTAESSRTDSVRSNRTSSGHRPAKNSSPTNDHSSPPSPPSPPPPPPSPPRPPPAETNDYRDSAPRELVTDTALNALGAKLMKAEMMGNGDKVEKLRKELDALRELKVRQEQGGEALAEGRGGGGGRNQGGTSRREEETLVLTKTDRFGRAKPLEFPSSSRPGPSRTPTHTKKGKREKYFADDDHYSLKALVEQERMTTAEETHAAIARMAAKFVPASNADETVDDVLDSTSITKKFNPARDEERQRQRAILESRKMADVLENCRFCFGSPQFSKHLLVAIGIHVYLTVPSHQSLTPGHCLLVPTEHTMCSMALDENVWSEVQVFQKGLTHMFSAQGMDAVFMETYTSTRRKTHMCIECIPVPKAEGELVPMYFKKAILESDEEWAQNKKLVDTRKKGVRSSIPTGLPYFFVDFGLDGGYAHIIEDQSKFPHYFGREVIGGLLDLEPRFWLKPPKEDFERQKEKVLQLSKWWKPYDWTQKLT